MSSKTQDFTTIDTSLGRVANRFELSVIVARRAEEIDNSNNAVIDSPHKSTVLALQEMSEGFIDVALMKEKIIVGMQKNKRAAVELDETSDENGEIIADLEADLDNYIESENELSLSDEEMSLLDEEEINFKG
jgi:DNA-directed RNA polymerase omega subunit